MNVRSGMPVWALAALAAVLAQAPLRAAAQTQGAVSPAAPAQNLAAASAPLRTYGISLLGEPSLPPDFKYFPYVNPDAPKGGEVALSTIGTFDSFNPFIVRGNRCLPTWRGSGTRC